MSFYLERYVIVEVDCFKVGYVAGFSLYCFYVKCVAGYVGCVVAAVDCSNYFAITCVVVDCVAGRYIAFAAVDITRYFGAA